MLHIRDTRRVVLLIALMSLPACRSSRRLHVKDGFESTNLNPIWQSVKFVPGALQIQSERVRRGSRAACLTLRAGDQIDQEKGSELERAELREASRLLSIERADYEYSFSLFLPADFPVVPTRLVLAQWKQDCNTEECPENSPVLAIRYESGELRLTLQSGAKKQSLYRRTEDIRNQWLDFRFHIRFDRTPNGRVQAWLNDRAIADFTGATAYTEGYSEPGLFYFKTGMYRDHMAQPMTVCIDEYEKRKL